MKTPPIALLTVGALVLGLTMSAHAANLSTPLLLASPVLCAITNVGPKAITVSVTALDFSGADVTVSDPTRCSSLTLDPNKSCVIVAAPTGPLIGATCHFTASGNKVRAIGYGFIEGSVEVIVVPATE